MIAFNLTTPLFDGESTSVGSIIYPTDRGIGRFHGSMTPTEFCIISLLYIVISNHFYCF